MTRRNAYLLISASATFSLTTFIAVFPYILLKASPSQQGSPDFGQPQASSSAVPDNPASSSNNSELSLSILGGRRHPFDLDSDPFGPVLQFVGGDHLAEMDANLQSSGSPVPEPGSLTLLALGTVALLTRRRVFRIPKKYP